MNEKNFRLSKHGTRLLKNNRPLFDWTNESDDIVDLLNELNDENEQLKQLIHTMLTQINTEKIGDPNTLYSARIVFTGEEFLLLNKIWKKGI